MKGNELRAMQIIFGVIFLIDLFVYGDLHNISTSHITSNHSNQRRDPITMPTNALDAKGLLVTTIRTTSMNKLVVDNGALQNATTLAIECGNITAMVDECFKELPTHLMEFLETTKIVINEQEIISKCTVFYRGMKCFDDYISHCANDNNRNLFKNNVEGAREFFIKFCSDREFQKDYLQHKDCFGYIQDDWKRCTKTFQQILSEELINNQTNITNKFLEFCCARHAYENCIYTSARFKCYPKSAKFARYTAKLLSDEKHFTNCRQYEEALCISMATPTQYHPHPQKYAILMQQIVTITIAMALLVCRM